MDFADIFLERADQLKYRLYCVLARSDVQQVTIVDLAEITHSTYQPVYNVFQELLSDIVALTKKPKRKVRKQMLAANELPLGIDTYRAYLVQRSMMYRLLDYTLTTPSPTISQFEAKEYVSRSTMARKLQQANKLMGRYGVAFHLAKLSFSGSELNVRFFLYAVYWWAYRGSVWPFKTVTRQRLHEECLKIGIMNELPVAQMQMQVFLAISHLRVGKNMRIADSPYYARFAQAISAQDLREGSFEAPFSRNDMLGYNFFQVSQPRFDELTISDEALNAEAELFADPAVLPVVDLLAETLPRALKARCRLNMMRLTFGYLLCGGPYPQAQELVTAEKQPVDADMVAALEDAIATMSDQPVYAAIVAHAHCFATQVAELCEPVIEPAVRVQIGLTADTEGYQALTGFVNCVPWIAEATDDEDADMQVGVGDLPEEPAPDVVWYPNAITVASFREALMNKMLTIARDGDQQRA